MTKQELKDKAHEHLNYIMGEYSEEIKEQIENTTIYSNHPVRKQEQDRFGKPSIILTDKDSVSAAFDSLEGKTCILNFASYKHPGGYFLGGSSAQEEMLCHESTLFPVLKAFEKEYYAWNKLNLNKALYKDRALYTPEVIFEHNDEHEEIDVLTCAAPNYGAARKYQHVTREENRKVFANRINFMYDIAEANGVRTLVLGAWGCGVFKQDPVETCELLTEIAIKKNCPHIKKIIFAIPDSGSRNYKAFKNTLNLIHAARKEKH